MARLRSKLTYANVMSTIAVFLVLGGATAIAAKSLHRHSVGAKQLKSGAVTTAKIKANAVTTRKIKKNAVSTEKIKNGAVNGEKLASGAVSTEKIANGTVTGAKIESASTPFSQVTDRLRGTVAVPFASGVYPLKNPSYTQPAGRDDQYVAAFDVTFAGSCASPRLATATLALDAKDPEAPTADEIVGQGRVVDTGSGIVARRIEFAPADFKGLSSFAPNTATQHTFTVTMGVSSCTSGSGITATGAGIDVIGTK